MTTWFDDWGVFDYLGGRRPGVRESLPPRHDVDVVDLVGSVRAAALLNGHRGATPVDRAALCDAVARVAALADDQPEIAQLELNPLNANQRGVDVLGATIHLAPASVRSDSGRRALT